MKKSSAYKVPYDLRPSKQTERRILLDILKLASECGLKLSRYEYIGFGGFKFYDFEMIFRHLGIRNMTSIELDDTIFERCVFNKPFNFIDVHSSTFSTYLEQRIFNKPVVAWLDYDCTLSRDVIDDLVSLGGKIAPGSFIFATIDARIPDGLQQRSTPDRVSDMRAELEAFALNPTNDDLQQATYGSYAEKVLWAALKTALSKRSDGNFMPLVRLLYKDSTPMITVGALLCPFENFNEFNKRYRAVFPFLAKSVGPYTIPPFNFTLRERHVLDDIVTSDQPESTRRKRLEKIGITKAEVDDYRRMIRYIPKYVETYL